MPGQERRRGWPQWRGEYATGAPVDPDPRSGFAQPLSGAIAGQAYTRESLESAWRVEDETSDVQVAQLERLHTLGRTLLELDDETSLIRETMHAAADLVRAPCATGQLRDGEGLRLVAVSGLPEEYLDPFRYVGYDGISTCAAALRERRRVLVVNFDFAPGFAAFAREAAALHLRAAMSTPVLDEHGEVAAMFTLYFDRPFQPTAGDLRLFDLCAQQVASHLQRVRTAATLRDSRGRGEQVAAEQRLLLGSIASGANLPQVLRGVTEAVSRMDPAVRACVMLLDEQGETFADVHSATMAESFGDCIRGLRVQGLENDPCGTMVNSGHPLNCEDIATDHSCSWRELCLEHDVRACHSLPIRDPDGNTLGAFLLLFSTPGPLDPWHAQIAQFGADLSGVAIERDRDLRAREEARRQAMELLERERGARQSAEHLARDSRWLAAIVTSSHDAIISKDLGGIINTWNEGAQRLFGYTAEEAIGQPVTMLMPPDRVSEEPGILARIRAGEIVDHYETVRQHKDGHLLDISLTIAPIRNERGEIVGASKIARDIGARKQAERELVASLARERAARKEAEVLVEASRLLSSGLEFDDLVQRMTDLATRLIAAEYGSFFYNVTDEKGESYMLYTLSGASRDEFDKMPMPRNTRLFQPTFSGARVVRCGDVREHPDFGKEAPYHGLPEGHLPVRSYLAVPVVSRNGNVHGGLFFAHSETNRFDERAERLVQGIAAHAASALDNVHAYREIAASESHLRQILDAMPAPVYTVDTEGKLTYFNPAAVEFAGRAPTLGSDEWCVSWKLYRADGTPMPHNTCPMAQALRENRAINGVEAIAERPDGTRRWFTPFPTPLHDAHGKLIGGVNMLVDITERKVAAELVAQAHARTESQRRLYEGVLSNTPDLAYVFDLDHRFIYANEALLAMWGKTREEALGKNCLELGYPGWHAAMHDREIDQVIASKRPLRGEVPFTGTNGRRIYDYTFVPVIGRDGNVEVVAGTTRDVTAQKEIEHRQRVLLDLSDRLRLLDDAGAIRHVAAEALARELGMSAAGFVEIEPDRETLVAGGEYCDGRMPDISGRRFSMQGCDAGYAPLVLAGENVFIEDYEANMPKPGNESGRELGLRSGAGVAVYNLGVHTAYMYLMHPQPRAWPETDRQLVREVAERAWAAVERVRAVDAVRRSEAELADELADMQLLTRVGAELVQEPTADSLFVRIAETAATLMDADCAVVHILDSERGELNLRAQVGLSAEAEKSLEWVGADARIPAAAALREGHRVVIGDIRQSGGAIAEAGLELFEREGINAVQSTPLVSRSGRLVGMLSTHWRQRHVAGERRLALLDLLARQAADLIENRRHEQKLLELNAFLERRVIERTADLEQSEQQVRRMASMLTMAEHAERRRISQVLHDDLQQQLHSIQMKLSAARTAIGQGKFDSAMRHLEVAANWSGEGVDTARRLTVDLSPPILKSEGLAESLEWLVSQMRKMHGLDVILAGERDPHLRDDAKRVLIYQIVRELLFNVVKYANTSSARIELRKRDGWLEICVVDEGVGFDPQKLRYEPQPGGGGFGLASAHERLGLVGGRVEIESAPGFGTTVKLAVPLDEPRRDETAPTDMSRSGDTDTDVTDRDVGDSGHASDWDRDRVA